MSRPTARAWEMLKRIARYLKGKPRLIWKYDWQGETEVFDITSDANWAGCKRGRKSTSGGTIMLGTHLIRTYSKTQATIAKSSGEYELYALVRASAEGLEMTTLLSDFGAVDLRVSIGMDASAAIGIAQRNGLNKVRHVEVDPLAARADGAAHPPHTPNPRASESQRLIHDKCRGRPHRAIHEAAQRLRRGAVRQWRSSSTRWGSTTW